MRVLITGGQGFLGRALHAELVRRFNNAATIFALEPFPAEDITDFETLERCHDFKPDVVFHLAAVHFVPWCREHPRETTAVNVYGSIGVLEMTSSAHTFVFASSAAVYGVTDQVMRLPEIARAKPVDVYGESKRLFEEVLLATPKEGRRFVAARLFNLVGPNDPVPHLLPLMQAARGKRAGFDLPALKWARDFVHVDDAAVALADLANLAPGGTLTKVNVCTGWPTTGWDLVKRYDVDAIDNPERRREGGGHLVGDPARLHDITGRQPSDPFGRIA